jgi:hypothetical protein
MNASGTDARPSRARRVLGYFAAYVVAPLLLLTAGEGVLRLCGYGVSTSWLLERRCNDTRLHSPNPAFYQQFSAIPLQEIMNWDELEFMLPDNKPPDTCRVFAFGESALFGTRSAVRILEVMLAARFPDRRFEVFNAACPGMNSHVLRAAASEAAQFQPDIFLIYMGNNEAVGPYGPQSLLGRAGMSLDADSIQRIIQLHNLRLVQLLERAARAPLRQPTREEILATMPGQTDVQAVSRIYADNLDAMLDSARDAGAATVLCTLTANRFFNGQTPPRPASLEQIERSPLNQAVLAAAASRANDRVWLADVDRHLYEVAPSGLPDYTYFSDNIHLNFEGAHQVACAMFDSVVKALPAKSGEPAPQPLTRDEAAALLGWNAAAEIDLLRIQVAAGFDERSKQILREKLERLEAAHPGEVYAGMAEAAAQSLQRRPDDIYLHRARFEALLFSARPDDALKHAEEMVRRFPCARLSLRSLGQALNAAMQADRAREAYERVLAIYPDDLAAQASLSLGKAAQ